MDLLRSNNKIKISNKEDLVLQIIDIKSFDEQSSVEDTDSDADSDDKDENDMQKLKEKFVIMIFGITDKGNSISIKVEDFEPYFYIYAPEIQKKIQLESFINSLKLCMPKKYQDDPFTNYGLIKRKKFIGFDPDLDNRGQFIGNKQHNFIFIKFRSKKVMQLCCSILTPKDEDGNNLTGQKAVEKLKKKKINLINKPQLYESNIDPILRFLHIRDIQACGWITILGKKYSENKLNNKVTNSQIDITTKWGNINHYDNSNISKLIIASYDIEADSSHGDFPIAMKGYKKLAANIYDSINQSLKNNHLENTNTSLNQEIKKLVSLSYQSEENQLGIDLVYSKANKQPYNSNLNRLSKLINGLFNLESGNYQLLLDDKRFPKGSRLKIKYYLPDEEENSLPCKEIAIYYIFNCEHGSYILKLGDIINKKGDDYYLIHNKENPKWNTKGNIKLGLRIKNMNEITGRWEYNDYTDIKIFKQILNIWLKKKSINQDQINNILDFETCFTEFKKKRDLIIDEITGTMDKYLPELEGDKIIEIGTVVLNFGEKKTNIRHLVSLKKCSPVENSIIESCQTEKEVIIKWCEFINKLDPDIILGYNIFGFDYEFIWQRAIELECIDQVQKLLTRFRVDNHLADYKLQNLSSAGLGDNVLKYIDMPGRVQIDLYKLVQRDYKLDSYKLDFVSANFINGSIKSFENKLDNCILQTDNIVGLVENNYISIGIKTLNGIEKFNEGQKYQIIQIDPDNKHLIIKGNIYLDMDNLKYQWGLAKDDVGPKDIFRLQKGTPDDRSIIAKYCLMDCELVIDLANKLQVLPNNIGMANVCNVPLSFIFLRGQGVKVQSLVSQQCRLDKIIIPVFDKGLDSLEKDGYEGAIVLKPKPGIYLDQPVAVLDYSSLYPSSMISENLSHDTIVRDEQFLGTEGSERLKKMGLKYVDVTYDNYRYIPKGKSFVKVINQFKPKITCRYIQPKENQDGEIDDVNRGIIPRILIKLLKARKSTRKKIPNEPDEFIKSVLEGLQLAFKVTANSVYGSIGAKTSAVFLKDIAASTTATGRNLLYFAKDFVEKNYPGSETIYGDTDSVFMSFKKYIVTKHGNNLSRRELLQKTIEYGMEAGERAKKLLKKPHDLEYEKTFDPFILLSKKRYVGNKYEDNPDKYKQTSMGIVLKRRDNAKIVKYVYGGIIDRIINQLDIKGSIIFLKQTLQELLTGKFPIDMLEITKTLKGYYKEPDKIAHKVLADRMASRDPGNKPQSNDRIPFVYIEADKNVKLQGDKIENPKFIIDNKLKIDYAFYITNQIMKPVSQIYALILEDLEGYKRSKNYYKDYKLILSKTQPDKIKLNNKIQDLRMKDIKELLFDETLRICENRKNNRQEITKWFGLNKKISNKDQELEYLDEVLSQKSSSSKNNEEENDSEDNYNSDFEDQLIEI